MSAERPVSGELSGSPIDAFSKPNRFGEWVVGGGTFIGIFHCRLRLYKSRIEISHCTSIPMLVWNFCAAANNSCNNGLDGVISSDDNVALAGPSNVRWRMRWWRFLYTCKWEDPIFGYFINLLKKNWFFVFMKYDIKGRNRKSKLGTVKGLTVFLFNKSWI